MNNEQLYDLIDKYVAGTASKEEEQLLFTYYESFQENINWDEAIGDRKVLEERMRNRLHKAIQAQPSPSVRPLKRSRSKVYTMMAAAVVVLIVGSALFFSQYRTSWFAPEVYTSLTFDGVVLHTAEEPLRRVQLGSTLYLLNAKADTIASYSDQKLHYLQSEVSDVKKIQTVNVQAGNRLKVVLADGTAVQLNAGSTFSYPISFSAKERSVSIEGEGYFDVAKRKTHPFVVYADDVRIQVLGTQFTLSNYPGAEQIETVLVEGSVAVYAEEQEATPKTVLVPGQKATWESNTKSLEVTTVETNEYTAWTNGRLVFKNDSFKEIRMRLERYYGVTIRNEYTALDAEHYSAVFTAEDRIQDVLAAFALTTNFKYKKEGKILVITEKNNPNP